MKKLLTACAACVLAGMVSAQVESVNIVGYQTVTASGQYFSSGPTFVTVGSATADWNLGDIAVSGMDPFTDFIQFLSPNTAGTVLSATYIDAVADAAYGAGDGALIGWWDYNDVGGTSLDAEVFAAGTGFLCNLTSTGVQFTYSGEVLQGDTALDLAGQKYPMIANLTPVDLTLADVTATGMDPFLDFIQFLSPTTAGTVVSATYIDAVADAAYGAGDGALIGWWDYNDVGGTSLDTTAFPAGASVLGNFTSTGVQVIFPNPVQ